MNIRYLQSDESEEMNED